MPLTAEAELVEAFRTRFGGIRTILEVERFQADLYRANHALMKSALIEAQAIATRLGPPKDARAAILRLYDTRLAEIAQMFPVFFIFESAYRSFTAARLAAVYGDDLWWEPIRQAHLFDQDPRAITSLVGRPAKRDAVDAVVHILVSLKKPSVAALKGTYDLLEAGTLAHVGKLIGAHWADIEPVLTQNPQQPLTSSNFADQFSKVRNARNDAYHHRLIRDRTRVALIAERLLDLLDAHLGDRVGRLGGVRIAPLPSNVSLDARHA